MSQKGILLIHGLTGSPHEFTEVNRMLAADGYTTKLVTLPGHGDQPAKRLHETSALEILDHCASDYEALAKEVDEVYIVGHSLGGICTLLTAAVQPKGLKGVVVFSAPYEHAYFYNYWHGLAIMPVNRLVKGLYFAPQDGIRCERPSCPPWVLPKLLQQSRILFSLMKEQLPNITVPVSLAHSLYDLTIPYPEMQKLATQISQSAPVKTTTLSRSGHRIFPVSRDKDDALRVITDFVERDCTHMTQPGIITASR